MKAKLLGYYIETRPASCNFSNYIPSNLQLDYSWHRRTTKDQTSCIWTFTVYSSFPKILDIFHKCAKFKTFKFPETSPTNLKIWPFIPTLFIFYPDPAYALKRRNPSSFCWLQNYYAQILLLLGFRGTLLCLG